MRRSGRKPHSPDMTYAHWRAAPLDVGVDGAPHCAQSARRCRVQSRAGAIVNIGGLTAEHRRDAAGARGHREGGARRTDAGTRAEPRAWASRQLRVARIDRLMVRKSR
jgi:hypothetical protein